MAKLSVQQPLVRLFVNDQEVPVQSIDIKNRPNIGQGIGSEVEIRAVARADMSIFEPPKIPSADIAKELKAMQDDLG